MFLAPLRRVVAKAKRAMNGHRVKRNVRRASRHISGPARIRLAPDQVACVCMVKNAAYYLDVLLDHHRARGVSHFLFIDNGSEDDTLVRLQLEPDVTVIANHLPVAQYETQLRGHIARRHIKGGWFLFIDSDELMDIPLDGPLTFGDLARYCNGAGYEAVISQSIDLFAAAPLSDSESWQYAQAVKRFDRYSLGDVFSYDYHDSRIGFYWHMRQNRLSNPAIQFKFGGMRHALFGEKCALTKHSMVRNAAHIDLYCHPHCSNNVHCADFTLLLRHYKFAGRYLERERLQVAMGIWDHGEDQSRLDRIRSEGFRFDLAQEHVFTTPQALVDAGFLTTSPRVAALARKG